MFGVWKFIRKDRLWRKYGWDQWKWTSESLPNVKDIFDITDYKNENNTGAGIAMSNWKKEPQFLYI